jgi:wobble nucleotide-excising tRNase
MPGAMFPDLPAIASHLRAELETKRFVLLYGYNGTGKTRLSGVFKDLGRRVNEHGETVERDTLYFNAFTEDLFSWDNDLKNDRARVLKLNRASRFFAGLAELEMDNRIRPLLARYADFDFRIDTDEWEVSFARETRRRKDDGEYETDRQEDIKVSRGEENIFIWCFFLAVMQLALDGVEAYRWVRYVYVDDPISSLDDNNAVAVAHHLAQMLKAAPNRVTTVVSTHHVLFFNVLSNSLPRKQRVSRRYFLSRNARSGDFAVHDTDSTPFLHHLASLVELHEVERSGAVYTHHYNMLRRVMEQTACFFGYDRWEDCIRSEPDDPDAALYKRVIDLMSHGDYSLYEPLEMMAENKEHFSRALRRFVATHPFSPTLFPAEAR